MKAKILLPILAAAMAATTAEALSIVEEPKAGKKEHKVGGKSVVLTDMAWQRCLHVAALDYRDESVVPATLSHDEPLYRISLRNQLPVRRTFTLCANEQHAAETTKTVVVEPMSTTTVTLPLALAQEYMYRNSGSVSIVEPKPPAAAGTDDDTSEAVKLANQCDYCQTTSSRLSLLLSEGITRDSILPAFKADFDTLELRRNPDEWPRDYRAYLPFDAICLAEGVEKALPDETRSALRAFELLGGEIVRMKDGASHPKDLWKTTDTARVRRLGDLKILDYRPHSYRYAPRFDDVSNNLKKVPLKVARSLPIGLLVAFLALVAVVAAPATVWYCAKKNKRLMLLAVLPGSAIALTVVVALVALAAYGTTPTLRVQSVTVLDPDSRLAVTRGQFAVFAPGQVTSRISVPLDTSLRLRGRGACDPLGLVCEDALRLRGDWVNPLSAAFFDFERAERRSERLDVKRGPGGTVTVANLLGSPVVGGQLQLDGQRYSIPRLAPGEQGAAAKASHVPPVPAGRRPAEHLARTFFSAGGHGRDWPSTQALADGDSTTLPEGTYVVRLEGTPFFPSPLAGTTAYATAESVVAGCVASDKGKEASK